MSAPPRLRRAAGVSLAVTLALLASACGDDGSASPAAFTDAEPSVVESDSDVEGCDEASLTEDERFAFTVAHPVIDGGLGAPCFGEIEEVLLDAWDLLGAIAPTEALADLGLFGGYEAGNDEGADVLAFVVVLDDEGTSFQMSVNLDEAAEDADTLALTMAHEFSHVFTAVPDQLDRTTDPDTCATFFNGEGCFVEDSLMADWVDTFWTDDDLDSLEPGVEAEVDEGEARCELDPGFLGPYAASNPEEDFAESFSAYALSVEAVGSAQQERLDWFAAYDDLVEYRERAAENELGPIENTFERCG